MSVKPNLRKSWAAPLFASGGGVQSQGYGFGLGVFSDSFDADSSGSRPVDILIHIVEHFHRGGRSGDTTEAEVGSGREGDDNLAVGWNLTGNGNFKTISGAGIGHTVHHHNVGRRHKAGNSANTGESFGRRRGAETAAAHTRLKHSAGGGKSHNRAGHRGSGHRHAGNISDVGSGYGK